MKHKSKKEAKEAYDFSKAKREGKLQWYELAAKKQFDKSTDGSQNKKVEQKVELKIDSKTESKTEQDKNVQKKQKCHKSTENKKSNIPAMEPLEKMFSKKQVPSDANKILEEFDKIVFDSQRISSKQRALLPTQVRELSHTLTDQRDSRRKGYMNETTTLSAYIYYFEWWNLVRLTRLFAGLQNKFNLDDGNICLDIGSGPLTLPIALFLARPDLREKKLTWYCLDISSATLSAGENLYYSICAKLKCEPWKIVRVKGEMGTIIKEKADFVSSANMFNEILQSSDMPPDYLSKKYTQVLSGYGKEDCNIMVVEPGVPVNARFVSLLRDSLMRKNFVPVAPCTHCGECPMDGKRGGKWCNFAFSTDDAPVSLLKFSESCHLPKERAVLSFILVKSSNKELAVEDESKVEENSTGAVNSTSKKKILFRIASDLIRLPGNRSGYYACSNEGLLLVETKHSLKSGEVYKIARPKKAPKIDEKSGALFVNL